MPPPSIEVLRRGHPTWSDSDLYAQEGRLRLYQQAMMCGFSGVTEQPPIHPGLPWTFAEELTTWLAASFNECGPAER